jgi:Fe2+ or Zn2+ uptake regulation protein
MYDLNQVCHQNGCRLTNQRENILRVLSGHPQGVNDIAKSLSQKKIKADKVTIYRTLDLFTRIGLVAKTHFDKQKTRYELITSRHHHHMICSGCGKVQDIPINDEVFISEIIKSTGFQIKSHLLEFFGFCQKCQRNYT